MSGLKLKDIRRMRARGAITGKEWAVICNMQGRGLKTTIDDVCIEFYNGSKDPVARVQRGRDSARLYPSACSDEAEATRYRLGLVAAKYDVTGG